MEKWCCERFNNLLNGLTEGRCGIRATNNSGLREFYIEAHGFDVGVEEELDSIFRETNNGVWPSIVDSQGCTIPLVKSLKIRILHCPKCGAELVPLINKYLAEFDALALQQEKILGASR
jgi:hypothetical protein